MASEISHDGIVKSITGQTVTVEIVSSSACASCHAAGVCGASDNVKKEISVPRANAPGDLSVADPVVVTITRSMGNVAVLLCYVIPLFILLAVAIPLSMTSVGELTSALIAFAAMGLWYLGLYLMRDRISGKYDFRLRKV